MKITANIHNRHGITCKGVTVDVKAKSPLGERFRYRLSSPYGVVLTEHFQADVALPTEYREHVAAFSAVDASMREHYHLTLGFTTEQPIERLI